MHIYCYVIKCILNLRSLSAVASYDVASTITIHQSLSNGHMKNYDQGRYLAGRAAQVDPRVAPGGSQVDRARVQRLKLKNYDEPLSNVAFNFNLRRYTMMAQGPRIGAPSCPALREGGLLRSCRNPRLTPASRVRDGGSLRRGGRCSR
jgi:hypothetical protein